ncbi:30S ribosomal protein S20 [Patescibacteria group bacterium]|nr:30S ribosomal protein S20 [Patescibacteria group bacterium]
MPITRSAKNALRQSVRRRGRNLKRKKQLTDALKGYRKTLAAGKKEEAAKSLIQVYKAADKLAKTGVIHKNRANRIKSRLAKKLK